MNTATIVQKLWNYCQTSAADRGPDRQGNLGIDARQRKGSRAEGRYARFLLLDTEQLDVAE
jgi:hypothetical protein